MTPTQDVPLDTAQPTLIVLLRSPADAAQVLLALDHPLLSGEYTHGGSTGLAVYVRRTDPGPVAEAAAVVARQAVATALVTGVRLSLPLG